MTIINLLVASAIVCMFGYGINNANPQHVRASVSQKEREVSMAMLNHGLSSYYYSHNGEYPDVINGDVLKIMGLERLNLTGFEYLKNSDGTYSLRYVAGSDGNITGHAGNST